MFKKSKVFVFLILSVFLFISVFPVSASTVIVNETELSDYFYRIGVIKDKNIEMDSEVGWNEFNQLFKKALPGHEIDLDLIWERDLNLIQAAAQIVKIVDQEEFVDTYGDQLSQAEKFYQAAQTIDLIKTENYNKALDYEDSLNLLLKARTELGYYNPYLGHINDENIYRKSRSKYKAIDMAYFQNEASQLFELGVKALQEIPGGKFTGYNIKDHNENPLFNRSQMIRYDHGNLGHLLQMISLLRRENFDVRWDIQSRISSYVHHSDEWGEPNPESVIEEIAENRVVVGSASYDILIEFADSGELSEFKDMIDNFARRKVEDTGGLIRSPYYAPVYASTNKLPGYEKVIGMRIYSDNFYLQSYILEEHADQVIEIVQNIGSEINSDFEVVSDEYFVNPEFVNYLEDNLE
ncbi:MAG: hypothetical protein ACLFQ4_09020 [Halanaerobium sp.]